MKNKIIIILVCVLFLISGCEQEPQMSNEAVVINIVPAINDEGTKMLLSEIVEDIVFIPLETTEECLIGRIRSIHCSNDYIIYNYN